MASGGKTKDFHLKKRNEEVPADKFADALKVIKAEQGLTWAQLADKCGRSPGAITAMVYNPGTWVSHRVAQDILERLSGASLPPTERQQAEYTALARKTQSEMRSETLRENRLQERKAKVAELRGKLR